MSGLGIYAYRPFADPSTFRYGMGYLELSDIPNAVRVCKLWNTLIKDHQELWKQLSINEGVPLVKSVTGQPRNFKEDLKTLNPRTISGKIIGKLFGKMAERVPYISEECFNRLKDPDPFEKGKTKGDNYVFIVDPSFIINKHTPLTLTKFGNLKKSSDQENKEKPTVLTIPFSLRNLRVLCSYSLKRQKNLPVFRKGCSENVFNQCDTCPETTKVYFMRKHIVEKSRELSYVDQEKLIHEHGFGIATLRARTLFNVVQILESGTCPDNLNTFACNPDVVISNQTDYRTVVGNHATSSGLLICLLSFSHIGTVGSVPCIPVDVPS